MDLFIEDIALQQSEGIDLDRRDLYAVGVISQRTWLLVL